MSTATDVSLIRQHRTQLPHIHSVSEFEHVLKRERLRADRNDRVFSLVVFTIQDFAAHPAAISALEEVLQHSIRISDDVGWFDEQRIAVMLPETKMQGAKQFTEKIERRLFSLGIRINSTVHIYPLQQKYFAKDAAPVVSYHDEFIGKMVDGNSIPIWKRAIDITISLTALLLLSPLFIIVAGLIKIVSPGPILFKQERVGKGGKIFNFFKFRTMHNNNNESLHRQHSKDFITANKDDKPMLKLDTRDSRIIPFGYFIRQSCIDELPQIINVLRGEMSIVGPRPCIPYEAEEYLHWHARRFDITPGLTGLWQVSGKNNTTFKEMIRYDIEYSAKRSFWLDLMIILKTPLVIVSQVREVFENKFQAKQSNRTAQETKEIPLSRAVEVA